MNKTKQFCALLKFQIMVSPFLWIMPLVLGTPLLISVLMPSTYIAGWSTLLTVQNLYFVGLIGVWVIAPEIIQSWTTNPNWSSGTEFLLTRAVDRPLMYRARAVLLYLLILALPLGSLLHSAGKPDLKVREYSAVARQECLHRLPGAKLVPDPQGGSVPVISIPLGNVLVQAWQCWLYVVAALAAQALLLSVYSLKHRTAIFYIFFMAFAFAPLIFLVRHSREQAPTFMETTFFSFASHPIWVGLLTVLALVVGEQLCERRFARLEQ